MGLSWLVAMEDWMIGLNAAGILSNPNFFFESLFDSRYFCFPDCQIVERDQCLQTPSVFENTEENGVFVLG